MGVMPIAHFQTLYLHYDASKVKLQPVSPSIFDFGRFHFTSAEIKEIERIERFKNKMAFQMIDLAALPVTQVGRNVTDPKISITESGRFMFNSVVQKAWVDVTKAVVQWDAENKMLGFTGFKTDASVKGVTKFLEIKKGTKDNNLSASGAGILKQIGYDFVYSKNQSFDVKVDEKTKRYTIAMPASGKLEPIERAPRKKKADKVVAATAPNGAVAPPQAPPEESELLEYQLKA